jgi:hypothetical protein
MVNRRALIQSGLALPAVSFAASVLPSLGASAGEIQVLQLERFVFDARFAEASDIAQQVERLGVTLAPTAGDLMALWYEELDLLWKQEPKALAGVTTRDGLFVLETLALDLQMRVVYRGEHGVADNGDIVHKLEGPAAMLERLPPPIGHTAWAAALGRAMTHCPLGKHESAELELVTNVRGISLRDVPLYSWIIAPRTAVALTTKS